MKRIILLMILGIITAISSSLNAQNDAQSIGKQYFDMGEYFQWGDGFDEKKDYTKAVIAYQKSAALNYPDGIMGLGEMYEYGLGGLKKDVQKSFNMFVQAYNSGSKRACYNLFRSYAYGLGCEVDYEKMILYLNEGIKRGDASSMFGMGVVLYKGWGIEQSYEKAIVSFERAVLMGSLSAKYYLGICYRNGYGVPKDEQKGKYYLDESAKSCHFSQNELKKAEPEIKAAKRIENKEFDSPKSFQKMKHNAKNESFEGDWTGYLSFYDWSGKYKLNEREIALSIKVEGDKFEGIWTQEGKTFHINGISNQYGIVFNSGEFDFADHFKGNVKIKIQAGSFETFTQGNNAILGGNISLFSITEKSPERPAYVILAKKKEEKREDKKQKKSASIPEPPIVNVLITPVEPSVLSSSIDPIQPPYDTTKNVESKNENSEEEQIVNHLQSTNINSRVWPVPFKNNLSVEYNLKTDSEIEIRLISMDGKLVGILAKEKRMAGLQIQHLNVNVPKGTYILQLISNNMKASHIVINE
ncbi:MAG: T9SS type A sorting domain-containing protein [Bacteroidota bacterium]|nr:T9SS type A sorting domain-containing protein [Bacteroidota bacterium]